MAIIKFETYKNDEDGKKKVNVENIKLLELKILVERLFNENQSVLAESGVLVERNFDKDNKFIYFDLFLERTIDNFEEAFKFLEELAGQKDAEVDVLTSVGALNGNIFQLGFKNTKENLERNKILLYYFEIFANIYKIKNGDYIDLDRYNEEHRVFVKRILDNKETLVNIFEINSRLVRLRYSLDIQPEENKKIIESEILKLEGEIKNNLNKIVKLNIK